MRADGALGSTGGSALDYDPGMRKAGLFVPVLFALVLHGCKEEPVKSEFGEPCEPNGCADGLACYVGYCEETCESNGDCSLVDGWVHECDGGVCHIVCDEQGMCPQDLGTPLECAITWCGAPDGS